MMRGLSTAAGFIGAGLLAIVLGSQTCLAQGKLAIEVSAQRVGKYEKIEFLIDLDARYANPFDPQEVDLTVRLETPTGAQIAVPAFHCQDYERRRVGPGDRQVDWLYPIGEPVWRARFAPVEVGRYTAIARLEDRGGTVQSDRVPFECTASERKGFLRVSPKDPRFFELSEGEPFFAIGQNLAFIGEQQYVKLAKAEEIFATLSRNGANFLRIWTCCEDWAMAVEARKSAWGRSWHWKPPIVPMPDDEGREFDRKCLKLAGADGSTLAVSPSHRVALRPNTRYVVSGRVKTDGKVGLRLEGVGAEMAEIAAPGSAGRWTGFRREFETGPNEFWLGRVAFRLEGAGTAWLDALSLKEAAGGPELLWEADVNRPMPGSYNPTDCFMLDQLIESAEQNGIYLQLCLITRDLYMGSLKDAKSPEYEQAICHARNLLRYAVARWGYSTSVAAWEYFNEIDPNLPTDRFYTELGEYLAGIDVYRHLRTTSAWGPSVKDCRHRELDVAEVHFYLRPAEKQRIRDEVAAVLDRVRFLRQHAPAKPVLVGEFGLATDNWRRSPSMQGDTELVHFHNSLWASALSGSSGTVLFWWWDQLDRMDAYRHYRPLADFLAGVPFTTAGLRETTATMSNRDIRLIGLQGNDRAYLWLFDPRAAWTNLATKNDPPGEIRGATLEIGDLRPGAYRIRWYDTHQGKVIREEKRTATQGALRLSVPSFARDMACKIEP